VGPVSDQCDASNYCFHCEIVSILSIADAGLCRRSATPTPYFHWFTVNFSIFRNNTFALFPGHRRCGMAPKKCTNALRVAVACEKGFALKFSLRRLNSQKMFLPGIQARKVCGKQPFIPCFATYSSELFADDLSYTAGLFRCRFFLVRFCILNNS